MRFQLNHLQKISFENPYLQQWGLENDLDTDINARAAWEYNTGNSNIVVAVIDTGVERATLS